MTKDNCLQSMVLTYEDEKDSVQDYLRAVAHNTENRVKFRISINDTTDE